MPPRGREESEMKNEVRVIMDHQRDRAWRLCEQCAEETWNAAVMDLLVVREPQEGETCERCGTLLGGVEDDQR